MKKKIVAGLLTAVMLCAAGCGNGGVTVEEPAAETAVPAEEAAEPEVEAPAEDAAESENAGSGMVVAFSQMEMNNAWRVAETGSIQDEAEKRGVELIYTDAGGDTAKQVSDVEDIVNQKPDVIMMAPREYEGMAPALEAAKAAGIPVLLLDRETAGVAGEDYLAFVGADFYWEGQECAKKLVERFGTDEEVNVVQITGTPGSSVAIDRQKGFEEELAKYDNFNIIATQNGEFTRSIAQDH